MLIPRHTHPYQDTHANTKTHTLIPRYTRSYQDTHAHTKTHTFIPRYTPSYQGTRPNTKTHILIPRHTPSYQDIHTHTKTHAHTKTHTLIPRKSNKLNSNSHNLLLTGRGQPNNDSSIPSHDIYNCVPFSLLIITTYTPPILLSKVSLASKSV